jgi:hypothetical protein
MSSDVTVVTVPGGVAAPRVVSAGSDPGGPTVVGRVPAVIDLSAARVVAFNDTGPGGGGSGGPQGHHHEQVSALATWTITHGLGFNPAGVVARDATALIEPSNITYPDANTCVLAWAVPVAGSVDLS